MSTFLRYQRNLARLIIALGGGGAAMLVIGARDKPDWLWGWIFGNLAGLAIFRLRVLNVLKLPSLPREQWARANYKSSMIAFAIMAAALLTGVLLPFLNALAVCAGVLLERAVLIGDGLLRPAALSETDEPEADGNGDAS